MDMENVATWFTIAMFLITLVAIKIARGKTSSHLLSTRSRPPSVNAIALLYSLFSKGFGLPFVHDLYTRFGSVFTINLFGANITLLVGPNISAHLFQGLESEISIGNLNDLTIPMFGQEVLYGVDTAIRSEQINFMVDALKLSQLRSFINPMFEEVEAYFVKWGQDGMVDLKHELEQLLMFISSRCLLGYELHAMHEEIYSLFHELEKGVNIVSFFFPYFPTPTNRRRDKAHARLKEIFSTIVRSRRSLCSSQAEEDVLQRLIDSKYKDGRSVTEEEISGMMIALTFAAKRTSAHTSIWTGARLLSNTESLMAALKEQMHIISKYENQIGYDAFLEMDTLHRCIKETLRMHTPAPVLFRKAHETFRVQTKEGKEYDIPGGHNVVIPTALNHKLPCIYKDPEAYDPDRFALGREEDKVGGKYSFTSFGGGRHFCPGMSFAYLQIKVIWSHLLRNFEFKIISPFPKTDWRNLGGEPKGKLMISYKRRQLMC